MSDKLDATISISADTSGVEAGIDKTKKSLKTLGTAAQQTADQMGKSGKGAGAGFEAIGTGVAKSAKDVERATRSMQQQLQRQIAELNAGGKATREYTEALARMRGVDTRALAPLLDQLDELKRKQKGATGATGEFTSSLAGMQKALVSAGAAAAAMKFISVADSVTTLNNQLKLATGSVEAAAGAYQSLFDIAQRSRVGFVELGETYASIARAAAPLGVSQERLLKVTESIGNAMTISGGSAQGLQAALVQLGQGLSSGALRGEELNSVMEQAPRLAKALADGLGVTTGQLRAMGAEGDITAEKVIKALESQSAVLKGEVAGSALTVGQAFTQLGNSATFAVGELDQTIGVSSAVAGAISSIASSLDGLGKVVADNEVAIKATLGFAGAVVGAKAATVAIGGVTAALAAARVATVGFTAALAANPIGAALVTVTALGAAAYSAAAAMRDAEGSVKGVGSAADAAAKEMTRLQDAAAAAGDKLAEAEKRLADLERKGAKGSANLMLREAHADAQRLVDKLKEAKRERDSLLRLSEGFSNSLRDREAGNSRGNRTNYQKDLFDSQQFLAERNDGITKKFAEEIDALGRALSTGAFGTGEQAVKKYTEAVTELNKKRYESTEAGKAEAKAAKDGAKGNKEGESSILSYIKSLEARTAAQRLEIAQGDKLTESQRARIQLEALLADSKSKASKSQIASAQASLAEFEANEAWLKNASDVEKALADMQKAREQSLQSVQDSVKKLVEEAEAAAYAETHNISLAEAVERLALARAENAYQQAVERQESQQTLDYLRQEIDARKQLVTATAQKGVKEANKKAAEQAAKDWEKVSQTIGDTLADYIMGGGKDAAQYLKRLFATLVLQPVVQTVVGGIMGTGSAAVAGGAANPLGLLQSGQSLWSSFSGGLSGTLATGVTQLGSLMGSSFMGELGAGIAAGGQLGIGGTASLIGSAGGTTGVGMTIGAAAPWIAGAAALYSIIKGFDNSGTPHMGAGAIYSGGNVSDGRGIYNRGTFGMGAAGEWSSSNQAAISGIAGTLGGALDGFAKAFGKEAGYTVATAFADDSSGDGAWGSLRIADALGNVLVDWERSRSSKWAPRIFADGEAGYQQYLSAVAGDVKKAFLAMDLPGWADEVLATAKDINTLGAAIQQIGNIKTVFDSLGKSMAMFSDLSGAAQTKLLQVSGGIDALAANAQSFYANYYSEQEKLDAVVGGLTTTLAKYGVQLPTTAEAYRALVEKQMAAGESAAELAAVLLSLNGTFKQVADAWKQELQGMGDAVAGIFDGLYTSIGQLKDATAADRASILRGDQAMSADAIAAAIQAASIAAPSVSGLTAAAAGISAAKGTYAQTEVAYKGALSVSDAKKQSLDETTARRDALQQQLDRATATHNATFANFTRIWDGRLGSYAGRMRHRAEWAVMEVEYATLSKSLGQEIEALNAVIADQTGVYNEAASATELYAKKLEEAKKAIESAQQAELQAKVEYASEMAQFIQDAGTSVTKLGDLRSEVVDFYQAQAEAVQAMLQSAGNLRSVVDQLRLGQLDSAQTAAELSSRYAANYSMALATSGSTRAGYVDAMAGSLPALTDALKAQAVTGEDWRIQTAKLFAQAATAAGLLEGDAKASNYQEVALGLLDSIDGALSELGSAAQSAQDLIVNAIEQGSASNLVGLRAVIAALKGDPIPAFAAGGLHAGGLRIVGEHGPELEATGPARIWNASQTAAMLGGGSINMQRVERLMEQRNEEARAQASAIVRLQQDVNRLLMRWETQGMPEQREVSAT